VAVAGEAHRLQMQLVKSGQAASILSSCRVAPHCFNLNRLEAPT